MRDYTYLKPVRNVRIDLVYETDPVTQDIGRVDGMKRLLAVEN